MKADKGYRITIVGGGSTTFVPPLLMLLTNSIPLRGSTVALMDSRGKVRASSQYSMQRDTLKGSLSCTWLLSFRWILGRSGSFTI